MTRPGGILVAALLAAAVAAPAALGTAFGVQDDRLAQVQLEGIGRRLDLVADTGSRWTRVDVIWKDIAPVRPAAPADPADAAYRWTRLDAIVTGLASRRIRPILDVYWGPAWANGGREDARWMPRENQYAAFVVALGKRYSGRFSANGRVRLPRVSHFELWNEPNLDLFFRPQWIRTARGAWVMASPKRYARVVRRTWHYMRRVRPTPC